MKGQAAVNTTRDYIRAAVFFANSAILLATFSVGYAGEHHENLAHVSSVDYRTFARMPPPLQQCDMCVFAINSYFQQWRPAHPMSLLILHPSRIKTCTTLTVNIKNISS